MATADAIRALIEQNAKLTAAVEANQTAIIAAMAALPTTTTPTPPPAPIPPVTHPPHLPSIQDPSIVEYSTEHGDHLPSKPHHTDFMRGEKELLRHLGHTRLNPYEIDTRWQLKELSDMFLTPLMAEPSKWKSFDAHCRQTNKLEDELELSAAAACSCARVRSAATRAPA